MKSIINPPYKKLVPISVELFLEPKIVSHFSKR